MYNYLNHVSCFKFVYCLVIVLCSLDHDDHIVFWHHRVACISDTMSLRWCNKLKYLFVYRWTYLFDLFSRCWLKAKPIIYANFAICNSLVKYSQIFPLWLQCKLAELLQSTTRCQHSVRKCFYWHWASPKVGPSNMDDACLIGLPINNMYIWQEKNDFFKINF